MDNPHAVIRRPDEATALRRTIIADTLAGVSVKQGVSKPVAFAACPIRRRFQRRRRLLQHVTFHDGL